MSARLETFDRTDPPGASKLLDIIGGSWMSQAVYVAAELRIADLLAGEPKRVDELAKAAECHAPSLQRLMSGLASLGICVEREDGRFDLTPMGSLLRSDAPDSLRSWAIVWGKLQWPVWGNLLHSVRTAESARYRGRPASRERRREAVRKGRRCRGALRICRRRFFRLGAAGRRRLSPEERAPQLERREERPHPAELRPCDAAGREASPRGADLSGSRGRVVRASGRGPLGSQHAGRTRWARKNGSRIPESSRRRGIHAGRSLRHCDRIQHYRERRELTRLTPGRIHRAVKRIAVPRWRHDPGLPCSCFERSARASLPGSSHPARHPVPARRTDRHTGPRSRQQAG